MDAKITAVLNHQVRVVSFLGADWLLPVFCKNFSVVVAPLTILCSPNASFVWTAECQHSFEAVKSLLCNAPVLAALNFSLPGAGAVLLQNGAIQHPVGFFSSRFECHPLNYSTIET